MRLEVEIPDRAVTVTAAPPALVSQRTCEHHLGIHRRAYLESLPSFRACGGVVLSLGRLRLVDPNDYVRWLRTRQNADQREGDGLEAMAEELGFRMIEGGGR